jgi:menaquinone-dependent protoporphyrinogen oxidase
MRVLVTWGSKRGGTEGIGRQIGESLAQQGFEVRAAPAAEVTKLDGIEAAVVGGALYANRWPSSVRRFVKRQTPELRRIPVWFFSSGPLDDSADRISIPAPQQVAVLAEHVGAKGHVTFGGRLEPNAKGFVASSMAKKHSGDWRNPERIRGWAAELGKELPTATAGQSVDHPAGSLRRLLGYAVAGWAACGVIMGLLRWGTSQGTALAVHALAAPAVFAFLARRYFRARGARDALPTALAWTALVGVLDLTVVAAGILHSFAMFGSIIGTWLPFTLIFLATWATGGVVEMMPARERAPRAAGHRPRRPRYT